MEQGVITDMLQKNEKVIKIHSKKTNFQLIESINKFNTIKRNVFNLCNEKLIEDIHFYHQLKYSFLS